MKSVLCLSVIVVSCVATAVFAAPKTGKATSPKAASRQAANSNKEKVTMEVTGADSSHSAAITKALTENGLDAKLREAKGKNKSALHLSAEIDRGSDLNQWTKVIGTTAAKGQPLPMLQLVLYAQMTKENATAVVAELEKVKGVDIKHTAADVKTGEIHVALNGTDHITADDITTAVQSAGVAGHFTKTSKTKQT